MFLLLCLSCIALFFATEIQEIFQPHIPIYKTLTMSQHLKARLQAGCSGVEYFWGTYVAEVITVIIPEHAK